MIVLVALLVCLIPTTIGGLMSAIGIAGMDRLVQRNVLAMSGRAVEAAGDVSTLLLDKTGTITFGNRQAIGAHRGPRRHQIRARGSRAAHLAGRRDPRGSIHRHPGGVAPGRPCRRDRRERRAHARALHGPDPDERRRLPASRRRYRPQHPQGGDGLGPDLGGRSGRRTTARGRRHRRTDLERGWHPARRRRRRSGPRRRPAEGRGEAGHDRTVRRAPRPRHPHGDDHRRQPADRRRHRGRGRRRRLPGRGHPRGQDGPHPQGAGGRQPRRHDRRRHQRRPRAGPGRCRAWP